MIEFGETLRKKREEKGLSLGDVAQKTNMLIQQVEALEKEDFSKIAAPIYGRGFVRLYCEAVGIEDPKPLVDEFMDIFLGNRPPTIRMRKTAVAVSTESKIEKTDIPEPPIMESVHTDAPEESSALAEPPIMETLTEDAPADSTKDAPADKEKHEPSPISDLFDFSLESEVIPPSSPAVPSDGHDDLSAIITAGNSEEALPQPAISKKNSPSKYVTPQPIDFKKKRSFSVPPVVLRLGVLALGGLLLIWLVFSGISCLYNAAMTPEKQDDANTAIVSEGNGNSNGNEEPALDQTVSSDKSQEVKVQQKRTPMKIPPLFID